MPLTFYFSSKRLPVHFTPIVYKLEPLTNLKNESIDHHLNKNSFLTCFPYIFPAIMQHYKTRSTRCSIWLAKDWSRRRRRNIHPHILISVAR